MSPIPSTAVAADPVPAAPATPPARPPSDAANDAQAHARHAGRIGAWVLGLGLVAMLVWVAYAPLDEGVPAPASVMLDTKRKAVQHLSGGIVKAVHVKEGTHVEQGQPLVTLDAAAASANHEAVRQRYLALRATEGRLLAERSNAGSIRFHDDVKSALADPHVQTMVFAQEQLFATRRAAIQAELQSMAESIEGHKGTIEAYRAMLESRQSQLALLKEELASTRGLVEEGYAPRNRQRELERMVADVHSAIADLQGNVVRATRAISELSQRSVQRRNEYFKEIGAQLSDVLRDVEADSQKFRAATEELQRMEVRAPATGQVVGLGVQTVGAVIQPAQKLMDIVPEGDTLLLEARVPPHLIDRIHPGLPVDARFSAFAHSPQLVVDARVSTVSADLITDPQTQTSFYLARVAVTPEGLKTLGNRTLHPGMPAEVVFRTGERSLLTYLLHPLVKRMAASMKEE